MPVIYPSTLSKIKGQWFATMEFCMQQYKLITFYKIFYLIKYYQDQHH